MRYYRTGLFRTARIRTSKKNTRHKVLWLAARFAIPRSEVCMSNSSLSYPAHVAFASYTALSLPSPCGRRYRLKVLWSDLTPHGPSGGLRCGLVHLTLSEGTHEASQVPGISLPACHALRPRQSLQDLTVTIPSCRLPEHQHRRRLLLEVTRLNCFGECGLSCGPQGSLCTLRISCSVVIDSLLNTRNTRYRWLVRPDPTGTSTL